MSINYKTLHQSQVFNNWKLILFHIPPATNLTVAPPNMVSPIASAAVNDASTSLPPMHAKTTRRTKDNNILGPFGSSGHRFGVKSA